MNHYAKLATTLVRLVAVGFFLVALLSLLVLGFGAWGTGMMGGGAGGMMNMGWGMGMAGFGVYAVLAIVLWLASKPIGRFVGGDLDDGAGQT